MRSLDIFTLLFVSAFVCIGQSIVMFSLHKSFNAEVRGVNYWAWAQLAMLLSIVLLAFRGIVSEAIIVPAYNDALLTSTGLSVLGTEKFLDRRPSWRLIFTVLVAASIGLMWWLVMTPHFSYRVGVYSVAAIFLYLRLIHVVWRHGERNFATYFLVSLMLLLAATTLIRGAAALTLGDESVSLLNSTPLATGYLAVNAILVQLLGVVFVAMVARRVHVILDNRTKQDPLTGVLNRRGCEDYYRRLQLHDRHADSPLTAVAVDIDFFKSINDRHGHAAGDTVLVHVASHLRQQLREMDQVIRLGGEEFLALLPGTNLDEAKKIAARIQSTLVDTFYEIPSCTLSMGIAERTMSTESLESILERADAALYQAKLNGRDRIECAA
ncbi:MAG: GGDEF domain-containing protein [Burkholderiaceae bacterium]|nr:GGDEF domain-containing protein [Burkholderiaceae bacterium]